MGSAAKGEWDWPWQKAQSSLQGLDGLGRQAMRWCGPACEMSGLGKDMLQSSQLTRTGLMGGPRLGGRQAAHWSQGFWWQLWLGTWLREWQSWSQLGRHQLLGLLWHQLPGWWSLLGKHQLLGLLWQ